MFRRRLRYQANHLPDDQLAELIHANRLLSESKFIDAGALYADMAGKLQQVNQPRRAANLYARAAHAFTDGADEHVALDYARKALMLFSEYKMLGRTAVFFRNITQKMASRGMLSAAETLQQEYGSEIAALPVKSRQAIPPLPGMLPTNCPKCGAPVHREEINWVDNRTIECEYCGTLIQIEE